MPDTEPDGAPLDPVADARNIVSDACACSYEGCRIALAEQVKKLAELLGFTFPADPVTITTADQIRAMPPGSVLLDDMQDAWQIVLDDEFAAFAVCFGTTSDHRMDNDHDVERMLRYAPFRVLHTPVVPDGR